MIKRQTDNLKIFKKAVKLSVVTFLVGFMVFLIFEPVVIGAANCPGGICTNHVTVSVVKEVTISAPADATFNTTIPGVSGNPGAPVTASLTWNVITNDSSGFDMTLSSSQAHALYHDSSYYFSDYGTPPTPTHGWNNPTSGNAVFGFSVQTPAGSETDTALAFRNDGGSCGAGSNTGGCWAGFNGTAPITVIHRTTLTDASGQNEVVNFKAESNGKILENGDYAATITATVSSN